MLIFVNEVDRAYRLKLFLEQFGIRTAVLNAELPLLSRHHIVEEYNRGIHDILIASDNALHFENVPKTTPLAKDEKATGQKAQKKASKKRKADPEFGVSRGVDFKRVDVVLNFDLGPTPASYVHRAGRTARNGQVGTVVSLISENEDWLVLGQLNKERRQRWFEMHGRPVKAKKTFEREDDHNEEVESEEDEDCDKWIIPPFTFDFAQIEGFRYRTQDALRAVTKSAIHEARMKDLRRELLTNQRLREHFSTRPLDIQAIAGNQTEASLTEGSRTANLLPQSKIKSHLKHVPAYLLESKRTLSVANASSDDSSVAGDALSNLALPQHPPNPSIRSGKKAMPKFSRRKGSGDPLKTFKSRK